MAARGAARKTYKVVEAAELTFDSDFSDRVSGFTDSGSDDEMCKFLKEMCSLLC